LSPNTKAEFVDKLAEKGKITKKLATEAIDLIFGKRSAGTPGLGFDFGELELLTFS